MLLVTVSPNMASNTCGMCGDFDGLRDNDLRDSYWDITDDIGVVGSSWNPDVREKKKPKHFNAFGNCLYSNKLTRNVHNRR